MYITDIKKNRKMYTSIYIDGDFFAKIDSEIFLKSGLKIGSEVDENFLKNLMYESDYKKAKDKSLYLLSFRDYSKKELVDKLKKDFSNEAVDNAVQRIFELGLVNDESFAKKYAKELLFNKHFSKRKTEFELIQKGIDKDLICSILDEIDFDPIEQIKFLVDKKYKLAYTDEKVKKRAFAFLQRYGYSWDDIKQVFDFYR